MEKVLVLLICALALAGCATVPPSTWNEEDSRILARELAADIIAGNWLQDFCAHNSGDPTLVICDLANHSTQPISLQGFMDDLARELLASGKFRMILPRSDVATDAQSEVEIDIPVGESGADILLLGSLELIPDAELLIFRVDLHLLDAASKTLLHRATKVHQKPLKQSRRKTT